MKEKITREQFIKEYCEGSGISHTTLKEYGMSATKCDCGHKICKGWTMERTSNPLSLTD